MNTAVPRRTAPRPATRSRLGRLTSTALVAAALLAAPSVVSAQPVQWSVAAGGNGNWYQYVPSISIFDGLYTFDAARSAALSSTHLGLQGYLATVTSEAEQEFINGSFAYLLGFGASSNAWLGASDADVEGEWRWLDGPEAGQLISYTNWRAGQPVNAQGFEDHDLLALSIVAASPPTTYGWTSLPPSARTFGYLIEYGSGNIATVPEPDMPAMLAVGLGMLGWVVRRRRAA